jgi:hypothetical protein
MHLYAAFGILGLGAIHLIVNGGQKEKPIIPKNSMVELKAALYSLMYLVFLTKKQERGSGGKYLKSQRIIYAFTIYVLGLAAITGFLNWAGILGELLLISHITAGVLVILVVVHRIALNIRSRNKVALRSIFATGTMPKWYVKKNHRAWYEEMVGREITESPEPPKPKVGTKEPSGDKKTESKPDEVTEVVGKEISTPSPTEG